MQPCCVVLILGRNSDELRLIFPFSVPPPAPPTTPLTRPPPHPGRPSPDNSPLPPPPLQAPLRKLSSLSTQSRTAQPKNKQLVSADFSFGSASKRAEAPSLFTRRRHATASVLVTHGLAAQPRVFGKVNLVAAGIYFYFTMKQSLSRSSGSAAKQPTQKQVS